MVLSHTGSVNKQKMKTKRAPKFKGKAEEVGGLRLPKKSDVETIRLVYNYRFVNESKRTLKRLQKLFHHAFLEDLLRIAYF